MSYSKDNIQILATKIKGLSPEDFLEEYRDTVYISGDEMSEVQKKNELQEILLASSTDVQLLALARQRFVDDDLSPDEQEAENEIENLWNRRWGLAESLDIPIKATELTKAELNMLTKRMIEWFQTRKELKENPEGVKNSFSEGNIYKA